MIDTPYHIILASNSPRRKELLGGLDLEYEVRVVPGIEENYPDGLTPEQIPQYLACQKAQAYTLSAGEMLITADTVVVLGREVLGKPADEAEARQVLAHLSGRWHSVFTGVSLVQGERHLTFSCETRVRFFDLTAAEIDAYIATGECMDKAGAYGIQGYGSLLVQEIQGDYFNVVGLPVSRLYRALNDFKQK